MPDRDGLEALRYFREVLDGRVIACRKLRKLAAIMEPRFEGGYRQWHYDTRLALRPVEFIERFCCSPQGRRTAPMVLEPFQLAFIETAFGFVDDDGLRQFHELLVLMARKQGKTTIAAGIVPFMLMADGERAAQCYCAATSKDQASLTYGQILGIVQLSRPLTRHLHKGIIPDRNQDGLRYRANGSYFTPLSSQTRNLDGLNVHFGIVDELSAITNRDTYDLLRQGTSARDQPLIMEITTNGFERGGLFDDQYDYASRWLDGVIEDDRFLPFVYELDDRSEWADEDMWVKANPGLGTIKRLESLRANVQKAKNDPSFLPTVLTKDFNVPENRASAWLRFDEAVNREHFDVHSMGFRYCVVGYDASDSVDLTAAVALMMRPGDDRIYELAMFWLPETALAEYASSGLRRERDDVPYATWVANGLVRTVPGNRVDHRVVFEWMNELRDELDVWPWAMGYDPWHLTDDSWQETARSFVGQARLEPVRWGAKTLSAPMKQIRADYAAHRIVDDDNPVMQWNRMNVSVVTDRNDNWLPAKGKGASGRIDGFAAELCAYIALQRHREEYEGIV